MEQSDKQLLEEFFEYLKDTTFMYKKWTSQNPTKLYINPEIMRKLSQLEGFYQRNEVRSAEVTAYAPMVRRFRMQEVVLEIYDRPDEPFLRVE